jgi:hypothetical protein
MKVTIYLTHREVLDVVRKHLGLQSSVDVDLQIRVESHPLSGILRQIAREFPDHKFSQKIAAIRRLRDLGPHEFSAEWNHVQSTIGLRDAKWAIENIDAAIDNLEKFGKIQP